MTDELKRYEVTIGYDVYFEDHYAFHTEAPNGEWVRYQDVLDRIEQLEALLRHARCPNKDCIDGTYPLGPDGELCVCEWCDERKALLTEDRE